MPRYEFTGDGSNKFWEIELSGAAFTTRWGRIGTAGQSKTNKFADEAAARKGHDKLVAEKLSGGYLPVGGAAPPSATRKSLFVRLETPEHLTSQACELSLEGRVFTRRSWWNGNLTETKTEKLDTPALAQAAFDRELQKHLEGDFLELERREHETVDAPVAPARLASNAELEAAMLAAPDDPAPAAVYADFLQSQGDARGELTARWLKNPSDSAAELLERHAAFFWGAAAPRAEHEIQELQQQHGFVTGLTLKLRSHDSSDLAGLTEQVLAAPLGAWLTSLRFGLASFESDNDWTATMGAVTASSRAAQLRALRFDAYTSDESEISWAPFGDFSSAWAQLPALEYLKIRSGAGGVLGELVLPRLKTFIRESGGLSAAELEPIVHARWPALEHLELWTGDEVYGAGGSVDQLMPILEGRGLEKLTHLGIVNCQFVAELLPVLARSKVLRQLVTLDLSKGTLMELDVPQLVALAPSFAHLESINLSTNQLSNEACERIREALPKAQLESQRGAELDDEGNPLRYVSVGE